MRRVCGVLVILTCFIGLFFCVTDFAKRQSWSELLVALRSVDVVEAPTGQK
jgi:hypothetical protein